MRNVKALAFVFIAAVSVFASQSVRADEFDQEMDAARARASP